MDLSKWVSLAMLTIGIAIVQLDSVNTDGKADSDKSGASQKFFGLVAVFTACCISGLAGVWFEKVLKGTKASLFLRNVQLSFFSFVPGIIGGNSPIIILNLVVYIFSGRFVAENGFFYGYNVWTWAAIMCQAVGGLIVAMVVK